MIRVQAPDGSIVEFPDGTRDDVMSGATAQAFGGPAPQQAPAPLALVWHAARLVWSASPEPSAI